MPTIEQILARVEAAQGLVDALDGVPDNTALHGIVLLCLYWAQHHPGHPQSALLMDFAGKLSASLYGCAIDPDLPVLYNEPSVN